MVPATPELIIRQVTRDQLHLMRDMLDMLGSAFDAVETYCRNQPDDAYLERLLASDYFIALAALKDDAVIGALRPTS